MSDHHREITHAHFCEEEDIERYAEIEIATAHGSIPLFLWLTYVTLPIWGLVAGYIYWEGSIAWLDRGHWRELQAAANTTIPLKDKKMEDNFE